MRSVIASVPIANDVWTEPTTQSSCAEQVVVVVGRAVGADVRLGADEHADAVHALVERADRLDLRAQRVGRDVVAEAVRGRVVGDRDVLEAAARARARAISSASCAAVAERRVHVQVALEVGLLDELRHARRRCSASSPRFSRSSGGIHGRPSSS